MKIVQIALPETLADEAGEAGLLAPDAIERMLRESLRQVRIERLKAAMALLDGEPPPDWEDEVAAEIAAYRAEKRAAGS